jgi:hypothetical protein
VIYHKKHRNEIRISTKTEAYIQSLVLKNTLENANYLYFEDIEEDDTKKVDALVNRIAVALTVVNYSFKLL